MIFLRNFSPTDVASVTKVVNESLREKYPPSLYLTIHNLWSDGFILLIERNTVAGFIAAVPTEQRAVRVLMLAVVPERRRNSYGQRLMTELYQRCIAKGIDTIVLEVRKSNEYAISFYEQQGFTAYGQIEKFYANGESALKMMKVLQS
ncbi:MAG TPA: N-acetyltransferase [Thermoplasmata archaeon]|jgi:ribosomal-protein-alanine N-acetyltransferase